MENADGAKKIAPPKWRFSSENQPKKRSPGRPRNVWGPLAKENNLSLNDVQKIYKNILTSKPEELNKIVNKYPCAFTIATVNQLSQELKGEMTGRFERTGRMIPSGRFDKKGNPIMVSEMIPERKRSYEMVKYMLDRIFGRPIQAGIVVSTDLDDETKMRVVSLFDDVMEESAGITPLMVSERTIDDEPKYEA